MPVDDDRAVCLFSDIHPLVAVGHCIGDIGSLNLICPIPDTGFRKIKGLGKIRDLAALIPDVTLMTMMPVVRTDVTNSAIMRANNMSPFCLRMFYSPEVI